MEIRSAQPEDSAVIAQLLAAAFAEFRNLYTPDAFRATTPSADQIAARLGEGPTWVAMDASSMIGTVSAVLRPDAVCVRSMAVLPAARGLGAGRRLLEVAQEFATAHDRRRIELSTTPFLSRAIELYRRFGFRECGTTDLFGTPLIMMEKACDVTKQDA